MAQWSPTHDASVMVNVEMRNGTPEEMVKFKAKRPPNLNTQMSNESPSSKSWSGDEDVTCSSPQVRYKLYPKRFLILALFCFYSMSNSYHWTQYVIIADKFKKFYNADSTMINFTSTIYMITYIPLILPASWVLERKGLRFCVIAGAAGTSLGAWIKCLSVSPDRFWLTMIGQTIIAVSQLFILNLPPRLAAVWFGENEVSRATAAGVFGNNLGIAFGFLVPPMLVQSAEDTSGMLLLFQSAAVFITILLILILLFFSDHPPVPPGKAAAEAMVLKDLKEAHSESFLGSVTQLVKSPSYLMLLISYGMNVGVFYAISTFLGEMVAQQFPGEQTAAGQMGFLMIVAGMLGALICGYVLDLTHAYKATTFTIYVSTLGAMIIYAVALFHGPLWSLYCLSGALGFFMTGYLPIGFEYAAEISYPAPEGTIAGLLNASSQVFGIVLVFMGQEILDRISSLAANCLFIAVLVAGTILTWMINAPLRRMAANKLDANLYQVDQEVSSPS